jgi:F-type H+-transporting ATPase subunit gamma
MAGVSTKEIKNRIRSMESTKQITKAMEMVAASKLRHAQAKVLSSRPYFEILYETIMDIAGKEGEVDSAYVQVRPVKRSAFIVIAGDRGLAGGYNANVLKMVAAHMEGKNSVILPVGKKAVEYFRKRGAEIISDEFMLVEEVNSDISAKMAALVCEQYLAGNFDRVVMVYTNFVSMLSQSPVVREVLPVKPKATEKSEERKALTIYEPSPAVLFDQIMPAYVTGMVFGAVCESLASELAARRNAMDAASKNAGEMIEELSLKYNRARQGAITQELTEIVAGAEAQ